MISGSHVPCRRFRTQTALGPWKDVRVSRATPIAPIGRQAAAGWGWTPERLRLRTDHHHAPAELVRRFAYRHHLVVVDERSGRGPIRGAVMSDDSVDVLAIGEGLCGSPSPSPPHGRGYAFAASTMDGPQPRGPTSASRTPAPSTPRYSPHPAQPVGSSRTSLVRPSMWARPSLTSPGSTAPGRTGPGAAPPLLGHPRRQNGQRPVHVPARLAGRAA